MRLDASNQSQSQSQSASSSLSNPLLNPCSHDTNPQPLQRFDFYTDPVGSFSGSKTRNQDYNIDSPIHRPNVPDPRNPHVGNHQNQNQLNQPSNHSPWRSPLHQPLFPGYRGPSHSPWRSPVQQEYIRGTPPPSQPPWRSPLGNSRGTPPSYSNYSNSPNFRPRGSPYPTPRHSSHSGGRGLSNKGSDGYYKKSMVGDPWRDLTPIVGDILVPRSGSNTWLPKSITSNPKRLKVGESSSGKKLSLAENLALSLEEAANENFDTQV